MANKKSGVPEVVFAGKPRSYKLVVIRRSERAAFLLARKGGLEPYTVANLT